MVRILEVSPEKVFRRTGKSTKLARLGLTTRGSTMIDKGSRKKLGCTSANVCVASPLYVSVGYCCSVNGPMEEALIDSFSPALLSLTPSLWAACSSPPSLAGFPGASALQPNSARGQVARRECAIKLF